MRCRDQTSILTSLCFVAVASINAQSRPCVAQEPSGADSPPEVLQAVDQAIADGEFGALVGLIDPTDRPWVAANTVAADSGLAVRFDKVDAFDSLLDKYELRPLLDPQGPYAAGVDAVQQFFGGRDTTTILGELLAFAMEAGGEVWLRPLVVPSGACPDLDIQGENARCTIDFEEVHFVRRDQRWYLDPDYPE